MGLQDGREYIVALAAMASKTTLFCGETFGATQQLVQALVRAEHVCARKSVGTQLSRVSRKWPPFDRWPCRSCLARELRCPTLVPDAGAWHAVSRTLYESVPDRYRVTFVKQPPGASLANSSMRYQNVCIESFGYTLPEEDGHERRNRASARTALPAVAAARGSSGADDGYSPTAVLAARYVAERQECRECRTRRLRRSESIADYIGALIHASVCRDHLEPATACRVHHLLEPASPVHDLTTSPMPAWGCSTAWSRLPT